MRTLMGKSLSGSLVAPLSSMLDPEGFSLPAAIISSAPFLTGALFLRIAVTYKGS